MSRLKKVCLIDLPSHNDSRGILTSIEGSIDIPFDIKRIFYIHNVVKSRGGHAHRDTDQVLIAISGSFIVKIFDGHSSEIYILNDPKKGLYIPKMIFTEMYEFSNDAVCIVLANTNYNIKKSIRNREGFISTSKK